MKRVFIAAIAWPLAAHGAQVNLNVQATVSGTIGSTTLNQVPLKLWLTIDPALITGAVGAQSTPNKGNGRIQFPKNSVRTIPLLMSFMRVSVSGGTLSFSQQGGSTITVSNAALASTDLRSTNAINLAGSAASGALSFATSAGTLTINAGALFSFHNGDPGTDISGSFDQANEGRAKIERATGLGAPGTTFTTTTKTLIATTNTSRDTETFLTRITGRLNGGAPVYDQTLSASFADPVVQAAVNQARAAITTAANGGVVNFTGPVRTSNNRTLSNTSQQTVDGTAVPEVTSTATIGPAVIDIADEGITPFIVAAGNIDIDVLTSMVTPRTITTTNTYQTSETYALEGSTQTGTPTGLRFVSLAPCRLMETRPEYNFQGRVLPFGPPFLNTAETRTFVPQLSNVCTVPSTAKAYVLNVTLVPRNTGVDFVTVYPAGETRPDFWTVRSPDGLIVANSAIVKAGAGGAISVYTSNTTDMLIDIAGYFTDNPQESNLVYYPLTPCRVIETRQAYRPQAGQFGPPTLIAKQTRNFRFPQSPDCAIPSGAAAYSVTLTVVPPAPLPFLTAWPAGASQPNVSSINSPNGRILANSVIVPASTDGSISLYPFETTDAIVDINGYFAPDNGSGLFYFPITQCRVSNSTDATFTGNFGPPIFQDTTTRTIPIASSPRCSGSPATAKAYALNATVIPNGNPMPFLTIFPTGQPQPNASVINAFEGQTVSSGFIVPAGTNGSIDVYAFRRTHVVIEIAGYFGR